MTNNTIITTITTDYANTTYNLPIEVAQMVSRMIEIYKVEATTSTPKVEPKATPKVKANYNKAYTIAEDGKTVTVGNDGFIPTKVFKGITYSLKQAGAKYDTKTKGWVFENKTKCKAWCKAQDARG